MSMVIDPPWPAPSSVLAISAPWKVVFASRSSMTSEPAVMKMSPAEPSVTPRSARAVILPPDPITSAPSTSTQTAPASPPPAVLLVTWLPRRISREPADSMTAPASPSPSVLLAIVLKSATDTCPATSISTSPALCEETVVERISDLSLTSSDPAVIRTSPACPLSLASEDEETCERSVTDIAPATSMRTLPPAPAPLVDADITEPSVTVSAPPEVRITFPASPVPLVVVAICPPWASRISPVRLARMFPASPDRRVSLASEPPWRIERSPPVRKMLPALRSFSVSEPIAPRTVIVSASIHRLPAR